MAKDFKSNTRTIKRILNEDLGKKCYRKFTVQKLKDYQKLTRKSCCIWIRKNINRDQLEKVMFTDEKIFINNGYFNPQNDVVWADSRSDANEAGGCYQTEKFPVSIMVGLGATWEGLTTAYFFERGERLNGKRYTDKLLPFYKKEGDRLFQHRNWGFQQDGASSHTDYRAQEWRKQNFSFFSPKEKWLPNSQNSIHWIYSIWNSININVD